MAQDGKSFFYVNPLEVLPEASRKDSRKRHVKTVRQKWFGCACCPPNLARLISSVGEYCFTENESTVFLHQYIGASVKTDKAEIEIESTYPQDGKVRIKIKPKRDFVFAIRLPKWSSEFDYDKAFRDKDGYAYINISEETEIYLNFGMKPKMIKCSNKVRANTDKIAVSKGPFIYCAEEADNGKNLQMLKISRKPEFECDGDFIVANGFKEKESGLLYEEWSEPQEEKVKIKLIPYHRWGNRGENEMSVYLRIKD